MFDERFGLHHKNQSAVLEAMPPVQYSVPFEWGKLTVTETAHQAYGLVPLIPVETNGNNENHDIEKVTCGPMVEVVLLGPDEINDSEADIVARKHVSREGVQIRIGFRDNKEAYQEKLIAQAASIGTMLGIESDEFMRNSHDEHGVPVAEVLASEVPQLYAHGLSKIAGQEIQTGVKEWLSLRDNKKLLRRISEVGGVGLAGSLLVGVSPEILTGQLRNENMVFAIGYLGLSIVRIRQEVRLYLSRTTDRAEQQSLTAAFLASTSASDIHKVFCKHMFDQQAEEHFRDS